MKINLRKVLAGVAVGSIALFGVVGTAGASSPVANSGQDGVNDLAVGGGSDTTYVVDSDLAELYNRSPGCKVATSFGGSPALGSCLTAGQDAAQANASDNWDHDVISNIYPTGSGGGINGVIGGAYDFARSSRIGSATELGTQHFWAFGKDGIAMVSFPGRIAAGADSLTKAQIQSIYNCTATTWDAVLGNGDLSPVVPYGMQSASGTYATFKTYLGFDPDAGACVKKLADGTFPFENDLKPIVADAATQGFAATNIIWWGSFGELKTYPYKAQSVQYWKVGGVQLTNANVANDTYGISRFIYRVAPKTSVDFSGTNAANTVLSTNGATAGKAGAVRRYFEWACQPSSFFGSTASPNPATSVDPYTGASYFDEQTAVIGNSGFQRVPGAQRTAGACRIDI